MLPWCRMPFRVRRCAAPAYLLPASATMSNLLGETKHFMVARSTFGVSSLLSSAATPSAASIGSIASWKIR